MCAGIFSLSVDIGDTVSSLNFNNNLTSSQLDVESFMKQKQTSKLTSGILKVYPAYQSGLAKGTSVKVRRHHANNVRTDTIMISTKTFLRQCVKTFLCQYELLSKNW